MISLKSSEMKKRNSSQTSKKQKKQKRQRKNSNPKGKGKMRKYSNIRRGTKSSNYLSYDNSFLTEMAAARTKYITKLQKRIAFLTSAFCLKNYDSTLFLKFKDASTYIKDNFLKLNDVSRYFEDIFLKFKNVSTKFQDIFLKFKDISTYFKDIFPKIQGYFNII